MGVPTDFGACWSANGVRLAHERIYARSSGAQTYTTRQIVVRDGDRESVAFEQIISEDPSVVLANRPGRCEWIADGALIVDTAEGTSIVDADGGDRFDIPSSRRVLGGQVFEKIPD